MADPLEIVGRPSAPGGGDLLQVVHQHHVVVVGHGVGADGGDGHAVGLDELQTRGRQAGAELVDPLEIRLFQLPGHDLPEAQLGLTGHGPVVELVRRRLVGEEPHPPGPGHGKGDLEGKCGLPGGGIAANDHHVAACGVDLLVQAPQAPLDVFRGVLGVVTGEELPEPLLHGEPPHPGTLAQEQVPPVDEGPAGLLVRRPVQFLSQLPQAVQAAGPLEGLGVGVRIGGGEGPVNVLSDPGPVGVPQVRRDQQRVHRFAPVVAVPDDLEDPLPLRRQEVFLCQRQHHGAHRLFVDQHRAQHPGLRAEGLTAQGQLVVVFVHIHVPPSGSTAAFSPGLPCWDCPSSFSG